MDTEGFKIFKANRLKFKELQEDAFRYLKKIYATEGQEFTMASPFAQIVNVVLHLGRMVLFYIENSITELNINTAFHDRSVRGLAALTGHNPSSGIAARGSLYMTYNMTSDIEGQTITIPNYAKIKNTSNGLTYLAVFPGTDMQITVGVHDSKIEIPIIQGTLKYQQGTGTGEPIQSFNFANKTAEIVDNFFMNIYVNGELWQKVDSLLDMGYNQKACMMRNSLNGGVDVFFGTGVNGKIPEQGAVILFEYLTCAGPAGNIYENSQENYWVFDDNAIGVDGDYVNLNDIYNLSSASDILFGSNQENIEITRKLAPHTSRSFVLANATNYRYFLTKLNTFSIIDAFSGFGTNEDTEIEVKYNEAKAKYASLKESYNTQVNLTGQGSEASEELHEQMIAARTEMEILKTKYDDSKLDDNIVYLYLVPDISKRLASGENYFTCSTDRFMLTDDEKTGILNLIESSGQKIITVENKILDPVFVRFAVNIFIQMWANYDFAAVKGSIISAVSDYLIHNTRRDRLPASDFVRIIEGIPGVDSVTVFFDADKNNAAYYGSGNYGIDEYGDIILSRDVISKTGQTVKVNDLLPLFRGPFTSNTGIEYGDDINSLTSTINITLRGKSEEQ